MSYPSSSIAFETAFVTHCHTLMTRLKEMREKQRNIMGFTGDAGKFDERYR